MISRLSGVVARLSWAVVVGRPTVVPRAPPVVNPLMGVIAVSRWLESTDALYYAGEATGTLEAIAPTRAIN